MKNVMLVIMASLVVLGVCNGVAHASEKQGTYSALFDEICQVVEANFYDASLIHTQFPQIKAEYRPRIATAATQADFSGMVNAMLRELQASHTYYLSPHDYEYYHLAAIFSFLPAIQQLFQQQEITYPTVGIITETIAGQVFIAAVLPGSVAEQAGLLAGDEIVAVNGTPYRPIDSLQEHVGTPVGFTIRRSAGGDSQIFALTPIAINPKIEMLDAERASIRLIETQGKKIGYIHIYSYAGEEYHAELMAAIAWGSLQDADALIIDLRYGLGGADPMYLNMFNRQIPVITSVDNTGQTYRYDPQWRKPAVYLVNKATRSGKEILAFGAKKYQLATVIGERTAGAVLGAALFPLSNGDLVYVAGRSSLIDGVNLEGVGVAPDLEVPMDIRYSNGKDIQIEKAVAYLLERLL